MKLSERIRNFEFMSVAIAERAKEQWADEVEELESLNAELLEALERFVNSKQMTGWDEGKCDLWLGPIWHKAVEAIRKAKHDSVVV